MPGVLEDPEVVKHLTVEPLQVGLQCGRAAAGTGLRIGEALAVRWDDLDVKAGTVEVRGTVLRVKGKGLVLKPSPKSEAGQRILTLPSWCIVMLQRRAAGGFEPVSGTAPIFPAPLSGTLRDPSNTRRGLREAFAEMGLPGLTSHAFRKTVATMMDDAGLSARAAADQLGHSKTSMTQDRYMGRKSLELLVRLPCLRRSSVSAMSSATPCG